MSDLWPPLRFSLLIAGTATVLVVLVGVPLAYLAARVRFPGKSLAEAVVAAPLVLPPTVVGYVLIVLFGRHGWVGRPLARWTGGYTVLFRPEGGVLAAAVVALPLLYLPARAAFAGVDPDLEAVATLFGATRWQAFWHVSLPLARRGIASGLVLAFGRALGEFGATTMVMGSQPDRQTLPIAIYSESNGGDLSHAAAVAGVCTLAGLSVLLVLAYNRWAAAEGRG